MNDSGSSLAGAPNGTRSSGGPVLPLKAWHVQDGINGSCVIIAPILVTRIDRGRGAVWWRMPNQPFDVSRVARFADVHSDQAAALEHAGRLLTELAKELPNELQR
jgi:hypothetical protein